MRLDINTLEPEFSKEEWRMIKDYLRWVKNEMKYPQKPEIVLGGARYPIGRFKIRTGIITPFRDKIKDNPHYIKTYEALSNVQTILDDLKENGKSVKSIKRKIKATRENN